MSASIVLSTLPRDAHAALRDVDARDVDTNGKEKKGWSSGNFLDLHDDFFGLN